MRSYISKLLMCILLIGGVPIYAIGNKSHTDPRVQVLQPSYEAQSLGDFAEVPVDLYTGRININIPLFTVSHNGIEVPVSLSYHGGGVKVDDECGAVGLGWTLNASGVVSRIVRGLPDELHESGMVAGYGRLDHFQCIGSNNRFHEFISMIKARNNEGDPIGIASRPTEDEKILLRWMAEYGKLYDEGHFDTAPDNFTFSVQGLYGAFINGKTSDKQANAGCSITQFTDSFHIIDANGLIYTFNETEQQYYPHKVFTDIWLQNWEDVEQQKFLYNSAWWLSSIKSAAGDEITFDYELVRKKHNSPNSYAYTQYMYLSENRQEKYASNFISPHNVFLDTVHYQHKRLTSISTPNARIAFHYIPASSSSDNVCRVDSISLYRKSTNGEDLVERYIFKYNGNGHRAKLSNLVRRGKDGQNQRYDFTYHLSCSVGEDQKDHWGYYSPDSKGTFPNRDYLNISPQEELRNRSSTRHANTAYAINNMLASITYPSGLEVKLVWEPHDYFHLSWVGMQSPHEYDLSNPDEFTVGGVRIKHIEYYDKNQFLMRKEYSYVDSLGRSTGVLYYPPRYASSYQMAITQFVENGFGGADMTDNYEPYLLTLRSNGLPYTLNGGGHIEYQFVSEVNVTKSQSGVISAPMNKAEYYFCTSAMAGCSDIDDTDYESLIPTDMLQLTSQKHQRGHLLKKVEYTDECKTTEYNYDVIEKNDVETVTGALFPIADFVHFGFNSGDDMGSINAYKNLGIVKYRVIPYNKRLVAQRTVGDKTNTYHAYTYANSTYSLIINADMPLTHTYTTSEGDTLIEHYSYFCETNKIDSCLITKNGYAIDGYKLDYDELYRVKKSYAPILSPTSLPTIGNVRWEEHESYTYDSEINKVVEVVNHKTNITTTYLWSYGGAYPIAEISNATLETVKRYLGETQISRLQKSYSPNLSSVDNLRNLLPETSIKTMTYEPLVGMTSYTDAKGYTLYYEYDDFGQIQEIYEIVGDDTKNVLTHYDYQVKNK